jgi:hypothetical protein
MNSKSRRARGTPPLLAVYLNDHLAGAVAGAELLRRSAGAHQGTELGPPLTDLAEEVRRDGESLRKIMGDLGVPVMRGRMALGWLGEKAGRLKPNGRFVSRSPLSDVLELEAMRLGVEGKLCAWRTLQALTDAEPRIDGARMTALVARAERQIQTLDALRDQRAAEVLTTDLAATEAVRRSGRADDTRRGAARHGGGAAGVGGASV